MENQKLSSENNKDKTLPDGSLNATNNNVHMEASVPLLNQSMQNDSQSFVSGNTDKKQSIISKILHGYKVLVLLRGAPGCGKSTLARELLRATISNEYISNPSDYILSSDDFFFCGGRYKYNVSRLSDAHAFNQKRAHKLVSAGRSPVIIDNTNMQLWEMFPYVEMSVRYGYLVEILEPTTPWRFAAGKLSSRTMHGVPAERIQRMLDKYEPVSSRELVAMVRRIQSNIELPQMRNYPPVIVGENSAQSVQVSDLTVQLVNNSIYQGANKDDNICTPSGTQTLLLSSSNNKKCQNSTNNEKNELTNNECNKSIDGHNGIKNSSEVIAWKPNLLNLLNTAKMEAAREGKESIVITPVINMFQKHAPNCRKENEAFATLRQIYPNRRLAELWDLFEKCKGDIDWAVDILLKEDELRGSVDNGNVLLLEHIDETFTCNCDYEDSSDFQQEVLSPKHSSMDEPKPQRQRTRTSRQNYWTKISLSDVVEHPRYEVPGQQSTKKSDILTSPTSEACTQTDFIDDEQQEQHQNETELIEISLGAELVTQLNTIFQHETEAAFGQPLSKEAIASNVFLSRSMAKDLYLLWIESMQHRLEEERNRTQRDDENFARLLKIPQYENCQQSPSNMGELLDLEFACQIAREEENAHHSGAAITSNAVPSDLAAHLSKMKLCEIFPEIPVDTLQEILAANNYCYSTTVALLHGDLMPLKKDEADNHDNLLLNIATADRQQNSIHRIDSINDDILPTNPEDSKRLALAQFEETRNLAAHHTQLKAECYHKAKEAVQKGNTAVAVYYSQVANFHKEKIDIYNHRAANAIMEVHRYSQSNPDLLDLHYLYVVEAVGCLDLFLDRHITALRNASRVYKHVFIITGRGLHSIGGVSSIKAKVKARLRDRNLRWSEVNPGLLKVKLFSASRHSRNF